ncbi:hypothetical protein P153DRAFT_361854 [Dothidotthia symphoricarpi CBS 119687]|uniref:Uncharacterized protein n=1 Tax=Dothidotthia symphoricarpi CBS 119687 TaxID=1392245 RepID=A0A6A5ZXH4_9PLEO|nr:uncharacterized protein P153DRAFT_361854 [Dothidotthia symphoricarpi CBS 119687]KAF2123614.1 hypothetical protein P153DRAFT_361854 [Dothidotthia symphoricarpi CBS 119687]
MARLRRAISTFATQLAIQSSQHRIRNAALCTFLLCVTCILTFLASNIANYVDSTPAPLTTLFAATFSPNCFPTFLHHPDPYLVLGIPSPPIFEHGGILNTADIGFHVYEEANIIERAYKKTFKCWHVDRLIRHKGLSMVDMRKISGSEGILLDARNRALVVAEKGEGHYPAWIYPPRKGPILETRRYPRESVQWTTSSITIKRSDFTFLREVAKGDATSNSYVDDQKPTFSFKQPKDCPPCTPDHLIRTFIEGAFTPAWHLPAQPAYWRHIPSTCARCDWSTIQESYTFFFGPWSFNWQAMTLNFTNLAAASEEGRLPPPGLAHEFWWTRDIDPPYLNKDDDTPTQCRIFLQLLRKYMLFTLRTVQHTIFDTAEERGVDINLTHVRSRNNISNTVEWRLWQQGRTVGSKWLPKDAGREWPQVIHLFAEQLAKYGRNTTEWKPYNFWDNYERYLARDSAREEWKKERKEKATRKRTD